MNLSNKLSFIVCFFIFVIPSLAFSAPTINSVSGTFNQSGSITVTGSGFDSKSTAGPMLFGDFENGTSGQSVTSSGPTIRQGGLSGYSSWQTSGANTISINTSSPVSSSSKHARVSFPNSSAWYSFVSVPYNFSTAGQKLYVSFDFKYSISSSMPRQMKAFIYYNSSSADRMYMSTAFNNCESGGWRLHMTQGGGDTGLSTSGPAINNEWVRLENYLIQGGVNQSNGSWVGSIIRANNTDTRTRTGTFRTDSTAWTQMALGGGYYSMCGSDPATIDIDNVYIDNTPQRIELGNASTWNATTYREILIPTAWSNGSVTATVRTGRFNTGQTAYLYVVDSSGAANSTGYPITIGQSGGVVETPPPVEDADTTPPVRSLLSPSGTLSAGTTQTIISLVTDESATCRWSASGGTSYASMGNTFSTTGGLSHSTTVTGLQSGQSYSRYVRCIDGAGNANTNDATISFSVASVPQNAGSLSWEFADYQAERSDGRIPVNIIRTGGSDGTVTVQWSSNGQTATHGVDYYGYDNMTVTFANGVTRMPISTYGTWSDGIEMIDNGATSDRYFQMILSNATGGATLGSPSLATVTILGAEQSEPPAAPLAPPGVLRLLD